MKDIIGVFDISFYKDEPKNKSLISDLFKNKKLIDISEGKQNSMILTDDAIFISRISSITLLGRSREKLENILSKGSHLGVESTEAENTAPPDWLSADIGQMSMDLE